MDPSECHIFHLLQKNSDANGFTQGMLQAFEIYGPYTYLML